jgi:hypothetical protein
LRLWHPIPSCTVDVVFRASLRTSTVCTRVLLVDYRCDGCAATHEVVASSPVADSIVCPQCGALARRRFGIGGLLGVRPGRAARERLDRERATKAPLDVPARRRLQDHLHGHSHDHVAHQRDTDGQHDHHDDNRHHDHEATRKESGP